MNVLKASAVRSRHLAPGDTLGKYEVIRQIAIGGMAELYLARTVGIEGFEKLVVLKRILPQYVSNATFVNMFLNEARLAATLHHPNVAQVYDIGVEDGDYFFAMEYVHGEDLDHMAIAADEQGVPISMDAALTLVAGLCAGLHYAHERVSPEGKPLQIVHRDVSPSNVLVSYDGAVKLVDFGIARASSRPGTTQGGLKGKIAYMSPEQCRAKGQLDRRSDIYAAGTILYQLTTGRMPFTGETEYQVLNQIVNDDIPPPTSVVANYPPALERVVLRALARDVDKRFTTAVEMQSAVEDFAHESRLRVSPLVLARLMGTLFPTRLEEWDHAKKQGAFFVEQHVVRTLIESGKTPDRSDPATIAKVAAAVVADDDPTHVNQALIDLGGDTSVGAAPISTANPPSAPAQRFMPTPNPPPGPQAYPIMSSGVMMSSSTAPTMMGLPPTPAPGGQPIAVSGQADVTERVRLPMAPALPTLLIRQTKARSRAGLYAVIALLATGAGMGGFFLLHGRSAGVKPEASASEPAPVTPTKAEPTVATPEPNPAAPEPKLATPEPTVATPKPTVAAPEPTVATPEPTVPEPTVVEIPTTNPVATKKAAAKTAAAAKRPKPKAEPKKPETKEQKNWNADSPFMPVRTK